MHFWIDKRSQQCGFGRSRVAASLSHAGGGLSYGHPPRRSKSSSNSNSNSNNVGSSNSGSHNQSLASVHRGMAAPPGGGDCQTGAGTSRQALHYASNISSSNSSSSNNNAHTSSQQQYQHLQHYTGNNNNSNSNSSNSHAAAMLTTTASNNNNLNPHISAAATSAAVLTGSGTIVPLVARGSHYHQHSTRYQPRPQQQHQQQQQQHLQQQLQQQQQQQHYSYSYHHPQFGNMAVPVRQYESQQQHQHTPQQHQHPHQQHQQHSGVYADDAYSAYHHHHSSSSSGGGGGVGGSSNNCSNANSNRYAAPRRYNSSNNMRHAPAATSAVAAAAATTAPSATPVPPTQTQTQATGHSNQLQQQHHALLQHADSQLLPTHLKCGMCASLVLASVFVAGVKFYFDHQGTGLEVLIFCAFSATFFLAACMVSLCRIPKGLLPTRSDGRAVCHSRGINGEGNAGGCMLELNDVRYLDERQVEVSAATAAAAAAGPPPYHIAILLPEQTSAVLGKQLPLDESPPPSYDKILV